MRLDVSKPLIMGILNLTPDSFFDEKSHSSPDVSTDEGVEKSLYGYGKKKSFIQTIQEISPLQPSLRLGSGRNINSTNLESLIDHGPDIIDIGAESSFGPEAQVSAEEEWGRLEPILKNIFANIEGEVNYPRLQVKPFISLDTYKAEVAEKALKLGVQMINDVTALRGDKRMVKILLEYEPYICLMYSADETSYASRTDHQYEDVMKTVKEFLKEKADILIQSGFSKEKIIVDPGLGFFLSSDPQVSWEVIDRLDELKELGFPILIGPSMKSFLGGEIQERLPATLEASRKCIENGASIVRVHDVKAHMKILNEML